MRCVDIREAVALVQRELADGLGVKAKRKDGKTVTLVFRGREVLIQFNPCFFAYEQPTPWVRICVDGPYNALYRTPQGLRPFGLGTGPGSATFFLPGGIDEVSGLLEQVADYLQKSST